MDDLMVNSNNKADEMMLIKKHSLSEIMKRIQYLKRTREAAGRLEMSLEEIQPAGLKKRVAESAPSMSPSLESNEARRLSPKKARMAT